MSAANRFHLETDFAKKTGSNHLPVIGYDEQHKYLNICEGL